MKNLLIKNWIIAILSIASFITSIIQSIWLLAIFCGMIALISLSAAIIQLIEYLEYKETERQFIKYLVDKNTKLREFYEDLDNASCNYIYNGDDDNDE